MEVMRCLAFGRMKKKNINEILLNKYSSLSIKELNKNGTYNIVFDGTVDGDVINGNIKGTVIATSTFEGKWNANAKNNSFKATVTTAGSYGDDKLAKNFIEGLNAATSYEGDSNNLYLLYKPASGKQTFRMVFRVVSSK